MHHFSLPLALSQVFTFILLGISGFGSTRLRSEEYITPTSGQWKGHAPGTWIVTRRSVSSDSRTTENVTYYKQILRGQDEKGTLWFLSGSSGADFTFTGTPSYHGGSSGERPEPDQVERSVFKSHLDDSAYTIRTETRSTTSERFGERVSVKQTLPQHPEITLAYRNETTDSFRGETYQSVEEEVIERIGKERRFDRDVTVIRNLYHWTEDRQARRRGTVTRFLELPGIESDKTSLDADGEPVTTEVLKIVGFGVGPRPGTILEPPRHRTRFSEQPDPESEFYRANQELLREMGFNDHHIERLMPSMRTYDELREMKTRIEPAWLAFQANPSPERREALLQDLDRTFGSRMSVAEPEVEALLVEISGSGDSRVAGQALSALVAFCSFRYTRKFEDHMIQNAIADPEWFQRIANSEYGNPSRVLERVPVPLEDLRPGYLHYAPPGEAVSVLLERLNTDSYFDLESLLGFEDSRVRHEFRQRLVSSVPQDGRKRNELLKVVEAAAVYNFPDAPALLVPLLRELTTDLPDPEIEEASDLLMFILRPLLTARILEAILETRDPAARERAVAVMKQDPGHLALLAMVLKQSPTPEPLFGLASEFQELTLEQILEISIRFPMLENLTVRQSPDLFFLLFDQRFLNDLDGLLKTYLPFYVPGTDYLEEQLAYSKHWYRDRMGLERAPWRELSSKVRETLLVQVLPTYGEAGTKVLLDLAQIPSFRSDALKGLVRSNGNRGDLLETIRRMERPKDPNHEPNPYDLALWVLGDPSVVEDMEQRLKYTSGNVGNRSKDFLPWLEREHLIDLTRRRAEIGIRKSFHFELAHALSRHRDKEAWGLIRELWEEETDPRYHVAYGRLFNQAAGRNFGLDRSEMLAWIQTLPESPR